MYDLNTFALADMIECGNALREIGSGAASMEEVASRTVRYLYDHLTGQKSGDRACCLVRLFKTHAYRDLDPGLQHEVRCTLGVFPSSDEMKCLTLLASAGERPEWNSRHTSAHHRVVPLPSPDFIAKYPMISQLVEQTGLELAQVLQPDPSLLIELEQRTFNVFHVPQALGSPYVPDQEEFVIPFGVRSVLGMGGVLPSGNIFAVVLFSRVPVLRDTANLFRPLALNVKMALLPYDGTAVFAGAAPATPDCARASASEVIPLRSEVASLSQLLKVSEEAMLGQSRRLQQTLEELGERAAELQDANQTLEALIQASPLPIIALDPDAKVQIWNPAAEQVFGWTQEEVIGRPYPLVPSNRWDEFRENMERLLNGESFVGVELRSQKKDGTPIDIGVWTAPVRAASGEVHCVMAVIEDLTERKLAAEALQESEEQVRLLLNSTGEAIYGVDLEGCCTFCNPACVGLLGYDDFSDLIGENMHDLIHHTRPNGEPYPRQDCRIYLAFREGSGTHVDEECLWRSDGTSFPAEYWSYPIRRNGEIIGSAVTFVDITERRQAESALHELTVLEERNRLARELHDSVSQLIYSTNLMAEAGRRFAAAGNQDQVVHYLGRLADTSRQALKEMRLLVNELRPLELEQNGIVTALRQRLDSVERRAGIDARLLCHESLVLPPRLEDELFRIAVEALNNSLKHAGATSVVVGIAAQAGEVELVVEDDGKGFDPAALGDKGGVGLVSMRQRVQSLDGSLAILSAPGEGTKVRVTVAGG